MVAGKKFDYPEDGSGLSQWLQAGSCSVTTWPKHTRSRSSLASVSYRRVRRGPTYRSSLGPLLLLTSGVKSGRFQSCGSGFGPASGAGDPEDLKRPTESDRTKVGMSGNPKTYRARLDRNPENGQIPTQAAAADSKEAKSWDDGAVRRAGYRAKKRRNGPLP